MQPAHTDLALAPFLDLIGRDIAEHPERLDEFSRDLLARIARLTAGVAVDHDAPLDDAQAL